MEDLNLNDISQELFIMNKYTVDKLFASENPADVFALYGFYYKTAKWQKTNSIKANDKYIKMCLKWGIARIQKAKKELKELGLIQVIQRRSEGKVEGWYIQVEYLVSKAKEDISVENIDSNNTQKQQVEKATSSFRETNALTQKKKCLNTKKEMLNEETKKGFADEFYDEAKEKLGNLLPLSYFEDFVNYRKEIKKPLKTFRPLYHHNNVLLNLIEKYSIEEIDSFIETMKSREWQTLEVEYIENINRKQQNNFQQETKAQRNKRLIDEHFAEMNKDAECDFDGEIS